MKIQVEDRVFDFDENTADNRELMAIEQVTGLTISQWSEALSDGSMTAVTALVWILRRRNGEPELKFDDVTFRPATIAITDDDEEGKESTG